MFLIQASLLWGSSILPFFFQLRGLFDRVFTGLTSIFMDFMTELWIEHLENRYEAEANRR